MAYTKPIYYVVNDNYNSDLNYYYDASYPDRIIYKQGSNSIDTSMIIFKGNNLPINDYFPDPPGVAYPVGYVGDTIHPSVDGTGKYVITMTSTIDMDRHPKFYVADNPGALNVALRRILQGVSLTGLSATQANNALLTELHGTSNGYLTYNNQLHTGFPFVSGQSDLLFPEPNLVLDPFFTDCWDRTTNAFYDISYHNGTSFFTSPGGVPGFETTRRGAFAGLDSKPIIGIDHFNTVAPITSTGDTIGIEFWMINGDNTSGQSIPAFIRGWSSGTISCGVTINDGTIYAYSNGVENQISIPNILNNLWNHIFVSYEQSGGGIGIRCWVNGNDVTLGGIPIPGNVVVGTHQETTSIGCYTNNGTAVDATKPTFGPDHQIGIIRCYDNDTVSVTNQVPYLYQATYDRFFL
jgi:hypothetical protein